MDIKIYEALSVKELRAIYEVARREGVLRLVGWDVEEVDFWTFLDVARLASLFFAGYRNEDREPLGFVYLSHAEGSVARIHFCLFRAGREDRVRLGREALDFCFRAHPWKCLIGLIPATFAGAIEYAREVGGREMGFIPGACWMARLGRCVAGAQFLFLPRGISKNSPVHCLAGNLSLSPDKAIAWPGESGALIIALPGDTLRLPARVKTA